MKIKLTTIILAILLITMLPICVSAQTPYSISVEPKEASAEPGETIDYIVTINADPGFEDSIYLELEVRALTYSEIYFSDTVFPPYPVDYEYSFMVPEDAPKSVTVTGIVRGVSGDYMVEEEVKVRITGGGIIDNIIGWIVSILDAIRNLFT